MLVRLFKWYFFRKHNGLIKVTKINPINKKKTSENNVYQYLIKAHELLETEDRPIKIAFMQGIL